jgi:hypothetical protein
MHIPFSCLAHILERLISRLAYIESSLSLLVFQSSRNFYTFRVTWVHLIIGFQWDSCCSIFIFFSVVFYRSFFVFFFFWPLYYLSFFNLRLLITPVVWPLYYLFFFNLRLLITPVVWPLYYLFFFNLRLLITPVVWPLYYLFFFNLRLLITPVVFSNFSGIWHFECFIKYI